jgi:hypothetical protein
LLKASSRLVLMSFNGISRRDPMQASWTNNASPRDLSLGDYRAEGRATALLVDEGDLAQRQLGAFKSKAHLRVT